MKFGVKLRQLRETADMTQEVLAKKLNVAKQTISQYENGKREPKTEVIMEMANIFGVSVDDLLGNTSFKKNPKIVLYGGDGKLVDISMLSQEDQDFIMRLAEEYKNKG
jgi:transcriptional regulator with XRE-family HTH domain